MSDEVTMPSSFWTLTVAAGAGFLLGGGFPPRRLVGLVLATSGRIALNAVLQQLIAIPAKDASADGPTKEQS